MQFIQSKRLVTSLSILGLIGVFAFAWFDKPGVELAGFAVAQAALPADSAQVPVYTSRFASSDLDDFVHSSAVAALPDGGLMSVWFAGTREGAADVQIRGARYDAQTGEWGEEMVLATRESTRDGIQKYIRKLGNPVIVMTPDNRLWLFYVSVSLGGWAGSAINATYSDDLGTNWSTPRQLVTSPFLNISTLVRSAPVVHADGSIGLPVYHEFLGKFSEYLYLDRDGQVIDKFRISHGTDNLQPTVVPLDEQRAVAMLRYAGKGERHVLASRTEDGGRTWSEPQALQPQNPNSSLAAVGTSGHGLLVALNDLSNGRFRLSLYGTDADMSQWRPVVELDQSPDPQGNPFAEAEYRNLISEEFMRSSGERRQGLLPAFMSNIDHRNCKRGACDFEYEYPYFIRGSNGFYHVVYSWNNTFIKHVSFNDAWLEERL
jgi:predicted neuraminidase